MKTEIYAVERKGPSTKSPSTSDESIVSTIGSSTTYTAVLENPRLIFKDRARKDARWNLKGLKMNIAKCPHCGVKLGNFMYADACPHCHTKLQHNRTPTLSSPKPDPRRERAWPVRMFTRFMRFVES